MLSAALKKGQSWSSTHSLEISGTTFTGNSAASGGTIASLNSYLWLGGVVAIDSRATRAGGAFEIRSNYVLNVTNCTLLRNLCTGEGGAIFIESTPVRIQGLMAANNTGRHGGALAVVGASPVHMRAMLLRGNAAVERGGAMYLSSSRSIDAIRDSQMVGNLAMEGSGLYLVPADGLVHRLSNIQLSNNTAHSDGGGIEVLTPHTGGGVSTSHLQMSMMQMRGNLAETGGGGGIFSSSPIECADCILDGNNALYGGSQAGPVSTLMLSQW
ncbi:hypothetical protein CYMTET_22372, partial [Cymbomonas tetramitiformis]